MAERAEGDMRSDRSHHEMRRVEWNLPCALTLDLDVQPGFGCLHEDFVVQTQREAKAVEPGPEVGARRRDDTGRRETSRQSVRHRVSPGPAVRRQRPDRRERA